MRDLTEKEAAAIAERKVIGRDVIQLTALPRGYKIAVGDSLPWPQFWNDWSKKNDQTS